MTARATTRPDPERAGETQHHCRPCSAWLPASELYPSCIAKGFWICRTCTLRGEAERRKRRREAALSGLPAARKRAPRLLSVAELTLQLLAAGGSCVLDGRVVRLSAVVGPAETAVMAVSS